MVLLSRSQAALSEYIKSALHDKHPRRSLDLSLQPSRGKTKLNRTMTDGRISIPALPRRWSGKGVCAAVFANNGRIVNWHGSIHEREPDSKFEMNRQPPGPPHVRRSNQRAFRHAFPCSIRLVKRVPKTRVGRCPSIHGHRRCITHRAACQWSMLPAITPSSV